MNGGLGHGDDSPEQPTPAGIGKLLLLLFVALGFYLFLHFSGSGEYLNELLSMREKLSHEPKNVALFIAVSCLLILFGTPRLLFFTLAGFFFSFGFGLVYALIATSLASLVSFNLFRWGGRQWARERLGKRRLAGWITRIEPSVFSVFLLRQLPISNLIINISLSLSSVGQRQFIIGSLLGFLPLGVAASLIGSGLASEGTWLGLFKFAMAGMVLLCFSFWFWRNRRLSRLMAVKK